MNATVKSALVAFGAGALFAVGLLVSGMTQPEKVTGFLDVTGAWDPSLAFVMIGAIGVHFVARRFIVRRGVPLAAAEFEMPKRTTLDLPLVVGAAIFGVGWGISGYCPGPSLVTLGSGSLEGIVFVVAMAGGMWAHRLVRPKARAIVAESVAALQPPELVGGARTDG